MFGWFKKQKYEVDKDLLYRIANIEGKLSALETNMNSLRGMINRKLFKGKFEEEEEEGEDEGEIDAATLQRNLLGFK